MTTRQETGEEQWVNGPRPYLSCGSAPAPVPTGLMALLPNQDIPLIWERTTSDDDQEGC